MQSSPLTYRSSDNKFINAIGITVMHDTIYEDFPMHNHNFSETFIIISGTATHVLGNSKIPLSRGDLFAVKGDTTHGFIDVHELDIVNLEYVPGFFQRPYSEIRSIPGFDPLFLIEPEIRMNKDYLPVLKLDDDALAYVVMMSNFILEQQNRDNESLYPVLRMNFQALVSYLATQYDIRGGTSSQISVLSRAAAFIEEHISDPIKVKDIAASVFLSPRQLERMFLKYYDETPMRYLHKCDSKTRSRFWCGIRRASLMLRVPAGLMTLPTSRVFFALPMASLPVLHKNTSTLSRA